MAEKKVEKSERPIEDMLPESPDKVRGGDGYTRTQSDAQKSITQGRWIG